MKIVIVEYEMHSDSPQNAHRGAEVFESRYLWVSAPRKAWRNRRPDPDQRLVGFWQEIELEASAAKMILVGTVKSGFFRPWITPVHLRCMFESFAFSEPPGSRLQE